MNIFGKDFIDSLRDSIVSIVQNAVKVLIENSTNDQRYLNKKQAIKYIGGMNPTDFDSLQDMGLRIIYIERPDGSVSIRYDKKELDQFMARFLD
ncbi:hypothetical protein D922_04456 [Enterococcus faecalis 06-MB-DW-09]|nr:hypothetical protein D922_04456 [Enterococcus faecalis 06-MB-DW-09]